MSSIRRAKMKPLLGCIQNKLGTTQGKGNALYQIVCAAIPQNLRDSIVYTRLKNRRLHLTVSNGGAASRLRFCQRALLEACAVLPEPPEQMHVRVAPAGTVKQAPEPELRVSKRKIPVMSSDAARGLRDAAACSDNKKLSEALLRLASRSQKTD